jgi:Ca2+-binding RTX toxin-like protein
VNGGSENDSIFAAGNSGSMQLFGSDGADTIDTAASSAAQTVVGGNDSSDGADSATAPTSCLAMAARILSTAGTATIP